MNHVLENCLVVVILLFVILIPVGIGVSRSRKRKKEKIKNKLEIVERDMQISFRHVDQLDAFVIAMDPLKKIIVRMNINDYHIDSINLAEIASCVLEEKKLGSTVQLVQLILRDRSQKTSQIIFYKQYHDNDWHLKRTLQLAAKWKALIQDTILLPI